MLLGSFNQFGVFSRTLYQYVKRIFRSLHRRRVWSMHLPYYMEGACLKCAFHVKLGRRVLHGRRIYETRFLCYFCRGLKARVQPAPSKHHSGKKFWKWSILVEILPGNPNSVESRCYCCWLVYYFFKIIWFDYLLLWCNIIMLFSSLLSSQLLCPCQSCLTLENFW